MILIAYHKAPVGRAADLPELLFGGETLALVAEFCKSYDKIINFTGTLLASSPVGSRNKKFQTSSTLYLKISKMQYDHMKMEISKV